MPRIATRPVGFALSVLVASCGGNGIVDGPDLGPPPRDGVCSDDPGPVAIAGQWAARADLEVLLMSQPGATIALCPDPQTRPARLTLRAVLTEGDENDTDVAIEICSLEMPTINGGVIRCPADPADVLSIVIETSDAFEALLPTLDIALTAPVPVATSAGTGFEPDAVIVTMGTTIAEDEPLPLWDITRPDCDTRGTPETCVSGYDSLYDQDGDGHLGVSLLASTGEGDLVDGSAYVAVRIAPTFQGQIRNARCIDGTVALNLEYSIIDSDVEVIGVPFATGAVTQNIPPLEFLPTSTFKLLRADAQGLDFDDDHDGTVTCAEILNNEGQFQR